MCHKIIEMGFKFSILQ